ncbi:MAG: porin [Bacteroidia bacterium]
MQKIVTLGFISWLLLVNVWAQTAPAKEEVKQEEKKAAWYEKISLRGYAQLRYNRLLETNPDLKCDQCDKSWGENGGFFFRRIRLIFSGDIGEHLYFYIQPDFASSASSTGLHFAQIRDAYFDVSIDKKKEFRFRFGQSKVPYGFENMQSSQNRLPLDRADATNSSVPNERDLGVMFYYAPAAKRELYKRLIADGLKGSGDYGVVGFGVYNGQIANRPEANNSPHLVARVSYPFEIGKQIIEPGVQAYTGKYTLGSDQLTKNVKVAKDFTYQDQRVAASLCLYPKPFGILAEYNIGKSPQFNAATDSIETRSLTGGFVTFCYKWDIKKQTILPYTRLQYYDGGKKAELDARHHVVREAEMGIEYQPFKYFELVAAYVISQRTTNDFAKKNNDQKGRLLRLQAQFNF